MATETRPDESAPGSNAIHVLVVDDGPGIDPSARETVFELGYSTNAAGTGMGLAIVKQIADAHGWAVDVSDSASGGAQFEFSGVDTP